jgi:hypothetical protein
MNVDNLAEETEDMTMVFWIFCVVWYVSEEHSVYIFMIDFFCSSKTLIPTKLQGVINQKGNVFPAVA